jgi:hypothetical protein
MKLKPIKKLIINGIIFDSKMNWENLSVELSDAERYAFDLFSCAAYPTYLKTEVEKRYGKQDWLIVPNEHIKYKKQRIENPEYFDYENYEYKYENGVRQFKKL